MIVVWTPEAEQDRADFWDYIAADNPGAAIRMDELFSDAAARLATHPKMGGTGKISGTRELIPHESYSLVSDRNGGHSNVTLWSRLQGGAKFPTGGKSIHGQARERLRFRKASRFGAKPRPTVIVRMREDVIPVRAPRNWRSLRVFTFALKRFPQLLFFARSVSCLFNQFPSILLLLRMPVSALRMLFMLCALGVQ